MERLIGDALDGIVNSSSRSLLSEHLTVYVCVLPLTVHTDLQQFGSSSGNVCWAALSADSCCRVQPLAPCGTALEGALLGSFKVNWVGGRTVVSAFVALAALSFGQQSGWGLTGVALSSSFSEREKVAQRECCLPFRARGIADHDLRRG